MSDAGDSFSVSSNRSSSGLEKNSSATRRSRPVRKNGCRRLIRNWGLLVLALLVTLHLLRMFTSIQMQSEDEGRLRSVLDSFAMDHHRPPPDYSKLPPIIPRPGKMMAKKGSFTLDNSTQIAVLDERTLSEAQLLAETLRQSTGFHLPVIVTTTGCQQGQICFLILGENPFRSAETQEEAYTIDVGANRTVIRSLTRQGLFYGTQTLLQLLPPQILSAEVQLNVQWKMPNVHIEDVPRFPWRGMHLDVARHFMPVHFVKKMIRVMAMYKLNTFHWHLTDDQGWRLEIVKYPLLTNISAWRPETVIGNPGWLEDKKYDGKRHGGFYSRKDVKEIVAYAAERHITIVPEIEMPGHTQAVLAAYPHLSCHPHRHYNVSTKWGVSEHLFCAGNDDTFEFLENVLLEVMELFPSKYIHIGGDECPKLKWETCTKCQKRIEDEGLKDENELQSWFIRRIDTFLNSHGRKLIGWDEIFEGGLAPNAAVMSWHGPEPAYRAAMEGHHAIVASRDELYFDWYQTKYIAGEPLAWGGHVHLSKVYNFDPVPPNQTKELTYLNRLHLILGAQGNLWTEFMPNYKQVEYMAFPRLIALAEIVWLKDTDNTKSFQEFYQRLLRGHFVRLDTLKVNYRLPKPTDADDTYVEPEVIKESPKFIRIKLHNHAPFRESIDVSKLIFKVADETNGA